jgi:hypothetical protein
MVLCCRDHKSHIDKTMVIAFAAFVPMTNNDMTLGGEVRSCMALPLLLVAPPFDPDNRS